MLRRQKHGVKPGVELAVDECHLKLALKVGQRAQPLDDHAAVALARKIRQKPVGVCDLHVGNIRRDAPQQLHALERREHRALVGVDHHAHDELVKALCRALNDIQMPVRDRVKAAGIDRSIHNASAPATSLR